MRRRFSSSPAICRLRSPKAAVFHSGLSGSSAATKVGSPPMVSFTSPSCSRFSTFSPSALMASHSCGLYGAVLRGRLGSRPTFMSNSNSTSHFSSAPLMGAADCGDGEQASGMCPSPAMSPEVGSSPTQPAPGR